MAKKIAKAVALGYDRAEDEAPRVLAKGQGFVAEKIQALALEHDIPVMQDAQIIDNLTKIELNQEIPEELFAAVAQILAFIYKLDQKNS